MMKPTKFTDVHPDPYFNIVFGCGNRAFYNVKEELHQIALDIGIEIQDGYISEECDYEGDLEKIIIYRGGREEKLARAVLDYYKVKEYVPEDMNIVLSIF